MDLIIGINGVFPHWSGKYGVKIFAHPTQISMGPFDTFEEAQVVYEAEVKRLKCSDGVLRLPPLISEG